MSEKNDNEKLIDPRKEILSKNRREYPHLFQAGDESPLDFVNVKGYIFDCG